MSDQQTNTKMKSLIEALLRKAEDAAATPEEAQAYAAKAQAMMVKHMIAESDLGDLNPDMFGKQTLDQAVKRSMYSRARLGLLASIADANGVMVGYAAKANEHGFQTVNLYGRITSVEAVIALWTSLDSFAAAEMKRMKAPAGVNAGSYRRSWLLGFSQGVNDRLKAENQTADDSNDGTLFPVLASDAKRAQEEMRKSGRTRSAGRVYRGDAEAADKGYKAGKSANMANRAHVASRPALSV